MKQRLTVIAPVYNESECLEEFYSQLKSVLDKENMVWDVIFVNDGSKDNSQIILQDIRRHHSNVKVIEFSRNFGHQVAVKAGLDHAHAEAVVIMDTDLQDAPEVIPEFIAKWREGFDVVYAVRAKRLGESVFKKWTASVFYRLMKNISKIDIPLDTGDFRLLSSRVVEGLRSINERSPFLRGLVSWMGYNQIGILVQRQSRFKGQTKYSLIKMLDLAWSGMTHFSDMPLHLCTALGLIVSIISVLWMCQSLYVRFVLNVTVPGWTSLMIAVLFLGSAQLLTLGIIGSYIGRIYDETRSRPLYLIKTWEGFEDEHTA